MLRNGNCVTMFLVSFVMLTTTVIGTPCDNDTHNCTSETQVCMEQNTTDGFACECVEIDQQVDTNGSCIAIPESQRIYLTFVLNVFGTDVGLVIDTVNDPQFAELVQRIVQIQTVPSYRGLKFQDANFGPSSPAFPNPTVEYVLLFTRNVTEDIVVATAQAALLLEERRTLRVNDLMVNITGHIGIFTSKDHIGGNADAVDWCAYPSLYRCPLNSTCRDVALRYECLCHEGFLRDGDSCSEAVITGESPFDTDDSRELRLLCDVVNATEVTHVKWRGAECMPRENASCVIRPQPPWDDGKNVTCDVTFRNGRSTSATFLLNVHYPPKSAPIIDGYPKRQSAHEGDRLRMTCTVNGGKPLVTSVDFSCAGHSDVTPDVIGPYSVTSILDFTLTSSDDGILCTCTARWKNGVKYSLSAFEILTVETEEQVDSVVPDSEDSQATRPCAHPSVYIVLAVSLLTVLFASVFTGIFLKMLFKKRAKDKRRLDRASRLNNTRPPHPTPTPIPSNEDQRRDSYDYATPPSHHYTDVNLNIPNGSQALGSRTAAHDFKLYETNRDSGVSDAAVNARL